MNCSNKVMSYSGLEVVVPATPFSNESMEALCTAPPSLCTA